MDTNNNTTRMVVHFFVTVFVIIVIITVLLLFLYYLTPNNYIIELYDETRYNLIEEYKININPESIYIVPDAKFENPFYKFKHIEKSNTLKDYSNDIHLLIKNIFKSQSIICTQDNIIHIQYGSQIIILNQNDNPININISIYKKN